MKKWGDLASAVLAMIVAIQLLFAIFGEGGDEKHKALVHRVDALEQEMRDLRRESTAQYKELTRLLMQLNNKR